MKDLALGTSHTDVDVNRRSYSVNAEYYAHVLNC